MASSFNELYGLGSHSEDANLEGWWPLQDNAASTTVVDASSNSRNGTLDGGDNTSTISTTGPNSWLTRSLNVDGTNDYIGIGTDFLNTYSTSAYSVVGRFSVDSVSETYRFIFSDRPVTGVKGVNVLCLGDDLEFWQGNGTTWDVLDTGGGISASTDYSFAATFASGAMKLYKDGSLLLSNSGKTFVQNNGSTTTRIGGRADATSLKFDGKLSGFAIFSRALDDTEVAQVHNGPEPINSVSPVVSGTETEGQVLSSTTGTWGLDSPFSSGSNGTITYAYQWTRSDNGSGLNEADIGSATSSTYTLQAADVSKYIRCRVRASNTGGVDTSADANSNFTGAISAVGGGDPEGSLLNGKLTGGGLLISGVLIG